ncbi:hypothetical protein BRADI_2g08817v3 [Brachypodium distachyon]|uniref:Uncharacterized protein n=1 Tax=Brachypodium distachyon TaxID=15368 RepID=A0A2K2D7J7_BRADI|nr:hypothetical protein BRADI_2g08817v3 [Brachypodium distachyon]
MNDLSSSTYHLLPSPAMMTMPPTASPSSNAPTPTAILSSEQPAPAPVNMVPVSRGRRQAGGRARARAGGGLREVAGGQERARADAGSGLREAAGWRRRTRLCFWWGRWPDEEDSCYRVGSDCQSRTPLFQAPPHASALPHLFIPAPLKEEPVVAFRCSPTGRPLPLGFFSRVGGSARVKYAEVASTSRQAAVQKLECR